jgi:HD-GYP domain-containing protein (c-di-GMP phosphodiesterase class II)
LNNLIYKNYNFKIQSSPIPYINSTLGEISKLRDNLNIIEKAIHVTLKGFSLSDTLNEIFHNEDFRKYLKFDRIGFATVEEKHFVADISISESNFLKLKRGFKIKKSESKSLMKMMENRKVRIINDLEGYYQRHKNSESTRLILEEGFKSSLTAPLIKSDGKIVGILFFSSKEKNTYKEEDIYKVSSILDIVSTIFEKNMLIEDLVTNSVLTFVKLVEGKDPETSNHIERMAYYSKIISKYLSHNPKYKNTINYYFIDNIIKFAPLHDIGKVGIPDSILLKPGKLTDKEFEIMKNHPKIGAKILTYFHNNLLKYNIDFFKMAIQLTVGHHEKWDGSGYPSGIRGTKIPLPARITAVADVFDAISSKRVYKEAFSFEKSVEIIKEMKGSHFDPDVVEAFLKGLPEIKSIYDNLKEV